MFLNNNIWLASLFALSLLAAIFGLLFCLAMLEPVRAARPVPGRARPVVTGADRARSVRS